MATRKTNTDKTAAKAPAEKKTTPAKAKATKEATPAKAPAKAPAKKAAAPKIHHESALHDVFSDLQSKIRARAYEIFRGRNGHGGNSISDWFQAESEILTTVALDWKEENGKYVVRGELPGFTPEEIDIHIENRTLTIGGTHKASSKRKTKAGESTSTSEIHFMRRMSLPADADASKLSAHIDKGTLEVTLPKHK